MGSRPHLEQIDEALGTRKWGASSIARIALLGDPVKTKSRRDSRRKTMGGTVVCGVTDAADDRSAAELARALGARLGMRLVLVHVIDGVPFGTDDSVTARQRQRGAEQILSGIVQEVGNGTEKRIVLGERAEALAQVAAEEGADLIVLGSRAGGLGNRKLRCTLARELEVATPVPVLIAPPTTRKRSDKRLSLAVGAGAR
jgi:nucleotide-binding universal stress UspA family protein